jgi:hypothetical protein
MARETQAVALAAATGGLGTFSDILSPAALTNLLIAIGRFLANEERVGITSGHQDVRRFVEWAIGKLSTLT